MRDKIKEKVMKHKKIIIIISAIVILIMVGTVAAINGFFGGGSTIPSGTFTNGLVGYWNFDEGSGMTVYDASASKNNGTWSGTGSHWTAGKVGGAGSFVDTAGDLVTIASAITTAQTISFWVNLNTTSESIISGDGTGITVASGIMSYGAWDNCFVDGVDTNTIATGWHYVVITSTTAVSITPVLGYTDGGLDGKLDEVRVYNRELSNAEIKYHYNRGGPSHYWSLNEGSGVTAYDRAVSPAGGIKNGTITGADWITGKYGSALDFVTGWTTNDIVAFGNIGTAKTISFWLNLDSTTDSIFEELDNVGVTVSSGTVVYGNWDNCFVDGVDTNTIATGWHHLVLTSTSDVTMSAFTFGLVNTDYLDAVVDEIKVYDYERTANEIKLDYNAGMAAHFGKTPINCDTNPGACMTEGLVGSYSMDEGSGSVAYDSANRDSHAHVIPFVCGSSTVTFTYKGASVTYGTVLSNGECWLDRNLGAWQVATAYNDSDAYGDLFQWGRLDDQHQTRTSGTTTNLSGFDVPGHANFIRGMGFPYDWRSPQNNNLWQGVSGNNNPCPVGWRLPTDAELDAERASWSSQNSNGAFASPLKLTAGGYRSCNDASLNIVGSSGHYWSSTGDGTLARFLRFYSGFANMGNCDRAFGMSVRCLKD